MKVFKKLRLNIFVVLMATFMLAISLTAGVNCALVSADTVDPDAPPAEITYIKTDVEDIEFVQHPTNVFFGFRLTESDYETHGQFEGDDRNRIERDEEGKETKKETYTEQLKTYERYVALWLTYWKNFAQMNSEGETFDQLYAYWDGSAVGVWFNGTVAHRCTLKRLDYGFVILIPAGTTFPSATYVYGKCEGTPIMYQTLEDKAFYYDGNDFVPLAYDVAQARMVAAAELKQVDLKAYDEAEQATVSSLIAAAKSDLKVCLTSYAIQERMNEFDAALAQVMSKEDKARLQTLKTDTKDDLDDYFNGLDKSLYDTEGQAALLALQEDSKRMIDGLTSFDAFEGAIKGVKFAVTQIPTAQKKAALAAYRSAAADRISGAFDETLYREAERAQGEALVTEGLAALEKAANNDEVDGISVEYIARIAALKTDAQWTQEEQQTTDSGATAPDLDSDDDFWQSDEEVEDSATSSEDDTSKRGCVGAVIGISSGVGVLAIAVAVIIIMKYKAGKKDEE